jgi:hypothetical protein
MVDLGEKAGRKIYRRTFGKAPREWTPEEQKTRLYELVGKGQVQEDMSTGHGPLLSAVGGEVIKDLEAAGMPVRPEEVAKLAPGDPASFWLFGKGFQGAHKAAGAGLKAVAPGAVGAVGRLAETAGQKLAGLAGGATQVAGKATELAGKGIEAVAPAAQVVAPIAGGVSYGVPGAIAGLASGRAAARNLARAGRGIEQVGEALSKQGAEIAGKSAVTGGAAQLAKDVLQAAPAAAIDIAGGVGMDVGLAAATSEQPAETANMAALGTFFGLGKAAMRTGTRAVSGQIAAPREWGSNAYAPASKGMPQGYESMHQSAYAGLTPGQQVRANSLRSFAQKLGTDFFVGSPEQVRDLLVGQGVSPAAAADYAGAKGFFTHDLTDASGKSRKVIIATDVTAAPHESFHAMEDVVGEAGMRQLDNLIKSEYGQDWEQQGRIMAARTAGVPVEQIGANWREVLADASNWGDAAALEKLIRENTPADSLLTEAQKQQIRDYWAQTKANGGGWRDIITEAGEQQALIGEVGDRYLARELAAENFDAAIKNMGTALKGTGVLRATAHVVANAQRFFGGEPLQGRTSEVGGVPLKYDVFQGVSKAGREAAPLVEPKTAAPASRATVPTTQPSQDAQRAEEWTQAKEPTRVQAVQSLNQAIENGRASALITSRPRAPPAATHPPCGPPGALRSRPRAVRCLPTGSR